MSSQSDATITRQDQTRDRMSDDDGSGVGGLENFHVDGNEMQRPSLLVGTLYCDQMFSVVVACHGDYKTPHIILTPVSPPLDFAIGYG